VGEYDIDRELEKHKMPLVLDADSSQHSAMIDVLKGKNVVIEGPPGSGKSQIIANLIALLMHEGKKVLFVSEKLVALEVVHQRLEQVGLGDFCMELHSHKTDKVAFLQSLNRRIVGEYEAPYRYEKIEQELTYTKQQLSNYVETLHTKYGSDEKTIFENIWLRENYLEAEAYFLFKISNAKNLKRHDLVHCEEYLHEYATHHKSYDIANSFWLGFEVNELSFMEAHSLINIMRKLEAPYGSLSKMVENFDFLDYFNFGGQVDGIWVTEPLGYLEFLHLNMNARLVLTDSGGLQEETTVLGVPCITMRPNTERPITISMGTNRLCTLDNVEQYVNSIVAGDFPSGEVPEYWDGATAQRITSEINKLLF